LERGRGDGAWYLFAKQPASRSAAVLGVKPPDRIASGVSIGSSDRLYELAAKVARSWPAATWRIKIKIKAGLDLAAVETVRARWRVPLCF